MTTTGGTVNTIPLFSMVTNIQNSILTQTAATAVNVSGKLNLPATAAATKTAGADSRPQDFVASSFSSLTSTAVNQTFQWQAEPAANDTASPSGTLNLLYGLGATAPSETGLKLSSKGVFTFATGQTFPGTGDGTVTSVATGLGLKGGPITKTGTLTIDTTKVPLLASANTFTGNQTVSGNLSATGPVSGSSYQIGSNLFAFGSYAHSNAFLGFAGNATMTGTGNTASGYSALQSNTTGYNNTAIGAGALQSHTTGDRNTAIGAFALYESTTGSFNIGIGDSTGGTKDNSTLIGNDNTVLGYAARFSTGTLTNATAVGALAEVDESNAMVLGEIKGVNFATASTNVGIGTTAPTHTLEVYSEKATTAQMAMITDGTDAAFSLKNTGSGGEEYWIDSGSGAAGVGPGNFAIYDRTAGSTRLVVSKAGNVGIGTISPDNTLSVMGSADKTGGGSWGTFSDGRLKNLNGSFSSGLSQVLKLNPVRYRYKAVNPLGIRDAEEHIGVVAQEVRQVIPEAVTENSKGYLLVNNDPIIWAMLNAIKEQQGEFRQQHAELAKALRQIKQQQSLLRAQTLVMRSLQAEVRDAHDTLRKVKAQVAVAQPALVATK